MKQVTGKQAPLFPFGTLEIVVAFLLLHGTSIKRREVENVSDSSANPKVAPPPRRRERERYDPPLLFLTDGKRKFLWWRHGRKTAFLPARAELEDAGSIYS